MKFILALSVVALAAVGCGHGSQDRPQQSTPPSASQMTKADLDSAAAAVLSDKSDSTLAQIASQGVVPSVGSSVSESDIAFYREQADKQQSVLAAQKHLLNQAIAAKNNTVQLTPELLDLTLYTAGSGFLGMDAYKGFKKLAVDRANKRLNAAPAAEGAAAVEEDAAIASRFRTWGRTVSTYAADGAPYVARTFEGGLAAIGAFYTVGKLINTANGVRIVFTDTQEIKDLRDKVSVAQTNLDATNKNLAVLEENANVSTP